MPFNESANELAKELGGTVLRVIILISIVVALIVGTFTYLITTRKDVVCVTYSQNTGECIEYVKGDK